MIEGWLLDLADRFWAAAGGPAAPPRDLQGAVSLALPMTTVTLPALALGRIEAWLLAHGIDPLFAERWESSGSLHGRIRSPAVSIGGDVWRSTSEIFTTTFLPVHGDCATLQ